MLHGSWLFTEENISAWSLVYSASPLLDLRLTTEQFKKLTEEEQREVKWWGFFIEEKSLWHVDFDVSKFINHSFLANVSQDNTYESAYLVATRNIKSWEEITQNYLEFESEDELRNRWVT